MTDREKRESVRTYYGEIAAEGRPCGCSCTQTSCCGGPDGEPGGACASDAGSPDSAGTCGVYSEEELASAPEGSNLGLGCGNPLALSVIRKGDIVLDLGSGAGFDCFLAAGKVGLAGKVIGVDMTPAMIEKARANAERGAYPNVEFRLGEIENLPAADNTVDLIISNCVVNLSTRKERVFQEACRVLKPGGRLMISDLVLERELPPEIRSSLAAYSGCVAGASLLKDYISMIEGAGFIGVKVEQETGYADDELSTDLRVMIGDRELSGEAAASVASSIRSASISAVKPG